MAFKSPVRFFRHDAVFEQSKRGQDLLWKFNIPTSERVKVLKLLDAHNLQAGALEAAKANAFSLFGSEESLMETIPVPRQNFGCDEKRSVSR
jgi:hypothetical protein